MPQNMRILLAEDNPADVYLIEEALRENGVAFEMLVAEDGEQALTMLADPERELDVVLLDLNMPKRGGSEVLAEAAGESRAGDRSDFFGLSRGQDAGAPVGRNALHPETNRTRRLSRDRRHYQRDSGAGLTIYSYSSVTQPRLALFTFRMYLARVPRVAL